MVKWRFLFERAPATYILATEEVITESVGRGKAPPTVRVNIFDPPAVLVGRHQCLEAEVNLEEVKKLGFDVNRRCTGGGAILMYEGAPGWEIWIPEELPGLPSSIEERYAYLSRVPVRFFEILGVKARYRPKNDVEVGGRKISGTGMWSEKGGLLFCGTILLDFDVKRMLRVLKLVPEKISDKLIKSFEERVTTVKRELGRKPSLDEICLAFKKAVEELFNVELVDGKLNDWEMNKLKEVIKKYEDPSWVYRPGEPKGVSSVFVKKTRAGLFRIYVKKLRNTIESVFITGDFFVYPQRAIYDLEATLKWTVAKPDTIREKVLRVFKNAEILGMKTEELADLLVEALCS